MDGPAASASRACRVALGVFALVLAAAPAALAAPGDLDPGFATAGLYVGPDQTAYWSGNGRTQDLARDSQGRLVAAYTTAVDPPRGIKVMRFTAAGVPDASFGVGGVVTLAAPDVGLGAADDLESAGVAVDGQDRPVISGTATPSGGQAQLLVVRLTAGGAQDPGFAMSGHVHTALPALTAYTVFGGGVTLDASGGILVAGFGGLPGTYCGKPSDILCPLRGFVARFTDGGLDGAYGTSGSALMPDSLGGGPTSRLRAVAASGTGAVAVGIEDLDALAVRLTASGQFDAAFSGDGIAKTHLTQDPGYPANAWDVAIDGQGRPVVAAQNQVGTAHDAELTVYRLTATGDLDTSFGGTPAPGMASISHTVAVRAVGVALDCQDRILATGDGNVGATADTQAVVARFTAAGQPDAAWGPGTLATGLVGLTAGAPLAIGTRIVPVAGGAAVVGMRRTTDLGSNDLRPILAKFQSECTNPPGGGTGGGGGGAQPPGIVRVSAPATATARARTTLTASAAGATRYTWKLGSTSVSCPSGLDTLTLRAPASGSITGSVTADIGGLRAARVAHAAMTLDSPMFTVPVSSAIKAVIGADVKAALLSVLPAYSCGSSSGSQSVPGVTIIRGQHSSCGVTSATQVGFLYAEGCMRRIASLADLDGYPFEQGMLRSFASSYVNQSKPKTRFNPWNTWASTLSGTRFNPFGSTQDANALLAQTDIYMGSVVALNGVIFEASKGSTIVVAPQLRLVASGDAFLSAGGIALSHLPDFAGDLSQNASRLPLGEFDRLAGGIKKVGGLPLAGRVSVALTPSGADLGAHLQLPPQMSLAGGPAITNVALHTDRDGVLQAPAGAAAARARPRAHAAGLDGLSFTLPDLDLGALSVKNLSLSYTAATDEWYGQADACFLAGECLLMDAANQGGLWIRHGAFAKAAAVLDFTKSPPPILVAPGVTLNRIGFGVGVDPTRVTGSVDLAAYGLIGVTGKVAVVFATPSAPYQFEPADIDIATWPKNWYTDPALELQGFTLGASGTGSIVIPLIDKRIPFANLYVVYRDGGAVAFGGGLDTSLFDIFTFRGQVAGAISPRHGAFDVEGRIEAGLDLDIVQISGTATVVISSAGAGACIGDVGGGVQYRPPPKYFETFIYPPGGVACPPERFTDDNAYLARAAQAGTARTVKVGAGEAWHVIQLDSATGAPDVQVTGPGGFSLSTAGRGRFQDPKAGVLRGTNVHVTAIRLIKPVAGTYTITPLPGSPAIRRLRAGAALPAAKATAEVLGSGATRTLRYDVLERPDQRVTFVESDGATEREIGTITGGGTGRLRWSPLPGRRSRAVLARFAIQGRPAERLTVARFRPPSGRLAKVSGLSVRRRGATLRVSWRRVPDATSYVLSAQFADGTVRVARSRGTRAVIPRAVLTAGATVRIRPRSALARGPVASARVRAVRRPATRLHAVRFERRGAR